MKTIFSAQFCRENGGAYTAVGTYDHHDILAMAGQLSAITGSNSRT